MCSISYIRGIRIPIYVINEYVIQYMSIKSSGNVLCSDHIVLQVRYIMG